jgi:hypothetical protein
VHTRPASGSIRRITPVGTLTHAKKVSSTCSAATAALATLPDNTPVSARAPETAKRWDGGGTRSSPEQATAPSQGELLRRRGGTVGVRSEVRALRSWHASLTTPADAAVNAAARDVRRPRQHPSSEQSAASDDRGNRVGASLREGESVRRGPRRPAGHPARLQSFDHDRAVTSRTTDRSHVLLRRHPIRTEVTETTPSSWSRT